jgi:arsenate reductase (thioredoxin)
MAEAWCNALCGEMVEAQSAGFEPGELNPAAVRAMAEVGIDISQNQTKSIFDLYREGRMFQYVITVCDQTAAEKCPVYPAPTIRLHWDIPDPANETGNDDAKLQKARETRDIIRKQVEQWRSELVSALEGRRVVQPA